MLFSKKDLNKHVEQLSLQSTVDILSQRFFDLAENDPQPRSIISIEISKREDPILFNSILLYRDRITEKFKQVGWSGAIIKVRIKSLYITLV